MKQKPAESNTGDIIKTKKVNTLSLSLLIDGALASLQDDNTVHKICNTLERTCDTKRAMDQIFIRKRLATIQKGLVVSMKNRIDEITKLILDLKLTED